MGNEAVNWGLKVAKCESGYQPYVSNHTDGHAKGLFQFMKGTFRANADRIGLTDASIWDWRAQIKVAAYMYSINQQHQWVCNNSV